MLFFNNIFFKLKQLYLSFWKIRFLRFLFIGGINTLFGFGVYSLLIFLGIDYKIAALTGQVLGVAFNFITTGRIVFENSNNMLLFKFICVYTFTYFLNIGLIKIFLLIGLNAFISGALCLLPVAVVSFLLNKIFVFKRVKEV